MRATLLGRLRNATLRAVEGVDRTAQRLSARANSTGTTAPRLEHAVDRPSSKPGAKQTQQVSNLGRVRSLRGIITEGSERADGYRVTQINGKKERIHRLVTKAFLPPLPSDKHTQVNHKDGDPANNRADNLEWVTAAENIQHSHDDTNAERKSSAPKRSKAVLGRRKDSEDEWVVHESISAAARALGLAVGSISACCLEKQKQTAGYEWKFAPQVEDQKDRPGEVWRDVVL